MTGLFQDVRYALRQLRKSPGFTAVAVLTLALGIGVNTAIFSVVQGVVLAPLPFDHPDQLVMMLENNSTLKHEVSVSAPDFRDWQHDAHPFQHIAAFMWRSFDLTGPGTPEHIDGKAISSDFFATLGTRLALGREFSREEDKYGSTPVVIISDRLWRDRFDRNSATLGQSLILDGVSYTVIGVLPPYFHFENNADIYTPLGQGDPLSLNDRTIHPGIFSIARLNPGVDVTQARMEMNAIQNHINQIYPEADRGLGVDIIPLKQEIVKNVGGTLRLLLGAVGLVLLITCANVASLFLARSAGREREFALRYALGAKRMRLIRQLLTEGVMLSLLGGVMGLAAAMGTHPILAMLPEYLPRNENIRINLPVLLFTSVISIAVGLLFGVVSALKSWDADLLSPLKNGSPGSISHHRIQNGLVIGQIALTLILLAGAGLLFRTIHNLWRVDPGFDAQHTLTFRVGLSPSVVTTAEETRITYKQLTERIRQIPGVQSVSLTGLVPLSLQDNSGPFFVDPQNSTSIAQAPRALFYWTGPEYLETMKIPLLRGRFLSAEDTTKSERVIVIDSVLARKYFAEKDPVGQTITVAHWGVAKIIGVVGHVKHWGLADSGVYTQNQVYCSFYQLPDEWVPLFSRDVSIAVRTPLEAATVVPAIKAAVYGAENNQSVYNIQTMQQIISNSMSSQRFPMILLGMFALLALVLASVGIYGVISYSVSQRVREIGIRMALGAKKWAVFQDVLRRGLQLVLIGLSIGLIAAIILTRLLSSFSQLLYGVSVLDSATFVMVSIVLVLVALAACYIPARRAAKVDPMVALRYE
jgi:predicted permease